MQKDNDVLVSVIMITYNHTNYIRQAIQGVIMQDTNFNYELLVGDDCSTDDTQYIISELEKEYPHVIRPILRQNNVGAIQNFSDLLSKTNGKYIAICDGDDFWTDSHKLQKQVDFLENNKEYTICCHPVLQVYDDKSNPDTVLDPLGLAGKEAVSRGDLDIHDLIRMNTIASLSTMYRWEIERRLPEWLCRYSVVDYVILLLHADRGRIGVICDVMGTYRKHSGGSWWNHTQSEQQRKFMSLLLDIDKELNQKYHDEFLSIVNYIDNDLKQRELNERVDNSNNNFINRFLDRIKKFIVN